MTLWLFLEGDELATQKQKPKVLKKGTYPKEGIENIIPTVGSLFPIKEKCKLLFLLKYLIVSSL